MEETLQLKEAFETACRIEKELVIRQHADDRNWDWSDYKRAEIQAVEALTGLTMNDLDSAYAYEACTGAFEYGYVSPRYYEGLKFGEWISTGHISYVELGHYEIDEENPGYQKYLKEKMEMVIKTIQTMFPNEMAAAGIGG